LAAHIAKGTVFLSHKAIGAQTSTALINPVPDNTGNACVVMTGPNTVVAEMTTLDEYFELKKPIDFIKIDVEGYELEVVKGAKRTICRYKPVMVIEQKPGHGQRYGFGERAAVDLVLTWGAKIAWERSGDYCLVWK